MSTTYSGPFDRKVELIDKIADILTDTDEITIPTGNRLCDALQRIADYLEAEAEASSSDSSSGGGVAGLLVTYASSSSALDKTAKEIYDVFSAGGSVVLHDEHNSKWVPLSKMQYGESYSTFSFDSSLYEATGPNVNPVPYTG